MTNKKKKAIPKAEMLQRPNKDKWRPTGEEEQNEFDFGGFPKDVDLKKNIGCGG